MYALAPSATVAVGASWSRSQEWLSCARVLVNCLDNTQPVRAPSADVNVADKQCTALPISRLCGDVAPKPQNPLYQIKKLIELRFET